MVSQETITVTACPICGSKILHPLQTRSDGVTVLQCPQCKMGIVEHYPADLDAYYADNYYAADEGIRKTGIGYVNYDVDAAHSLSWVIYLIQMLRAEGGILDIGCANGYLLNRLGKNFDLYGIEVNTAMAQVCQSVGIKIISNDISDLSLLPAYKARFDVITAIAMLEHVSDMLSALNQIKALLAPDGVFIFEVPLISDTHDNTNWYTSSLEHIYYPTEAGLHYIFEKVFGWPLIGGEVVIRQQCSTFVGLVSNSKQTHDELTHLYASILDGPIAKLSSQQEQTLRFLFEVVHAATTNSESLALLPRIDPTVLTPGVLERLSALWQLDRQEHGIHWRQEVERLTEIVAQQQAWIDELEQGKRWLEQQHTYLGAKSAEQQAWINELEHGKAWLKQQLEQQAATLADQRQWIDQLQEGKAWLEEQLANWQAEAERRNTVIAEQQQWIAELERAKAWHEQQAAYWHAQIQRMPRVLRKIYQ